MCYTVLLLFVTAADVKKLDCDVGTIKLRVKYGDVCKERNCEAIVNSTNAKLDLNVGACHFLCSEPDHCLKTKTKTIELKTVTETLILQ